MAIRTGYLEPGERTKVIELQQLQTVTDGGFPVETWATLDARVFAAKFDVSGRERFATTSQLSAAYDTRFEIGYRADMDPDLLPVESTRRVIFNGRVYDIVTASQIGLKEGIELTTLSKADRP
jgi:SPP1 family predicted phage head-tail adaptor